jgi:type II secretory pathway pseudopilin PulG
MTRRGFTYTELLCAAGIIALVWLMLLPYLARSRTRADETECLQHLRNLSWALSMYAQDHSGHLPPRLTTLSPRYLAETGVFRCPRVVAAEKRLSDHGYLVEPRTLHYAYQPGLCIDDRPEEAVVWDSVARHRGLCMSIAVCR